MNLEKRLNEMVGRTFMYHTRLYKVLNYRLNGRLELVCDKRWFDIAAEHIEGTLDEFLPVAEERALAFFPAKKELINIKDILMENIERVRQDKTYVGQANAINKSVNTLINMAKLEIQYQKMKEGDDL